MSDLEAARAEIAKLLAEKKEREETKHDETQESGSFNEDENNEEESKERKLRGNTSHLPPRKVQNSIFFFGAPPGYGVDAETKMMVDVRKTLQKAYNRATLKIEVPNAFDNLVG